jgi:hypothetical protein
MKLASDGTDQFAQHRLRNHNQSSELTVKTGIFKPQISPIAQIR